MTLALPVLAAFCVGYFARSWATILACPIVVLAIGLYGWASEPPNYDMPGFALIVGGVLVVPCVVAWLLGRGVRWCTERGGRRPE